MQDDATGQLEIVLTQNLKQRPTSQQHKPALTKMSSSLTVEDNEYEIPLRDQRYFGAGLKRKRIQFVPSTTAEQQQSTSLPSTPSTSAADRYLSIVLKSQDSQDKRSTSAPPEQSTRNSSGDDRDDSLAQEAPRDDTNTIMCDTCRRTIPTSDFAAHETSIPHQISLAHSHPPSHVDRTRKGLAVLESQGWDPDSRLGLGAKGSEGRLYPVRATDNKDRAGLGAVFAKTKPKEKPAKLDAGKVREQESKGKKKAQDLRNAFYRSEEVEKYLGQDQTNHGLDLGAFKKAKRGR